MIPMTGHIGGLDFNNSLSTSFNPSPRPLIGKERWVLKVPVCGLGVWLSHPWVDLLGRSTADTSPPKRMVALVGLVEFNEREY
jgi:hypothetical protein